MVRILTCHHFGGQKIGKCDEALQLTVADDFIVLALEHQVSVYNSEFPTDNYTYLGRSGFTTGATRDGGDIGSTPIYFDSGSSATSMNEAGPTDPLQNPNLKQPSPSKSHAQSQYQSHSKSKSAFSNSSSSSLPPETQIRFSHSFPTVDLIESISYNQRGNYLLCLEKREKIDMSSSSGGGTNSSSNTNPYDNTNQGQSQYQGQSHGHGHGQGHGHRNQSKSQQSVSRSIRVYFNWDNVTDGSPKPMKARIAGLVSPTGGEPDDDVLCMVEIPGRPITNNLIPSGGSGSGLIPNILAVSSCNILGHLASLTDASTVNIYSYRLKDHGKGRGRTTNSQYADFDFSYCVEIIFSLTPQRCRINFLADIIAVSNTNQLTVFRLTKHSRNRTRSISNESGASGGSGSGGTNSSGRKSATVGGGAGTGTTGIFLNFAENHSHSQPTSLKNKIVNAAVNLMGDRDGSAASCDKVVFDPKNECVKVHMNLITRANQKRRFTDTASGIYEEFQEEIGLGNRSRLLHTTSGPALIVEDLLRVYLSPDNPNHQQQHQHGLGGSIVQVELYALKVKDDLGGVSCVIGTSSQAFVYHLPVRKESSVNVCRVVTYPLTAPLVTFAFDSLFFHALTETGLETYTSRSLYHPIKEFEGFERYKNDCPFQEETPSLVGIRPFMGVRYMAANELLLCLLASPANNWGGSPASTEENQWTIYALQLPNIDLLYDDISKAALQSKITNPETHATLTSELHLILRSYINMNPEMEPTFRKKYQQTCKGMGIEFMKRGSSLIDEIQRLTNEGQLDSNTKYDKELYADDLLDKGVTYLNMSGMDLKSIFEEEPSLFIKDKKMIRGITRFINVMIPSSGIITTTTTTTTNNSPYSPNNTNNSSCVSAGATTLSPKLAAAVTEFLVAHSPESLVTLVINVPILRESNSAKLLQILKKMAESSGYKKQESIALLLTLITISGCDQTTRTQVKEILSKCTNSINSKDINNLRKDKDTFYCNDMDTSFDLLWLLDLKNLNEPKITDLTVCLSAAGSSIPVNVLYQSLMNMEVTIGQLMRAFSQGINLNADLEVQQALTRTLTNILEYFFLDKLKVFNTNVQQSQRFSFKSNASAFPSLMNNFEAKTTFENNILNNSNTTSPTPKPPPSFHQLLSDDEKHAVKTLVRSYISHVTLKPVTQRARKNSGGQSGSAQAVPGAYITPKIDPHQKAGAGGKKGHEKDKEKSMSFAQPHSGHENSHAGRRSSASPEPVTGGSGTGAGGGGAAQAAGASTAAATPGHSQQLQQPSPQKSVPISANKNLWNESKLTFFGKVPNFLIHIIKEMNTNVTATGGGAPQQVLSSASTSSFLLLSTLSTANDETKEYFIKLASLLASPIGNTPGVREIVIKFLETKGQGLPGTTLHTCLQLLVEPAEKAVSTLIAKYPLALMYYAKEMFGRSTSKWKILVSKLKEKIYSNSEDVEMFATIIESVYLYLANTLNPTELEEVLDKEEENTKFFKACRRTELANSYSSMVIQMSNEYLK